MKIDEHLITNAISLATSWQNYANDIHIEFDREFHLKMQIIMNHPEDKVLLIALLDQAFRSHDNKRVANQIDYLLTKYGMAHFFSNTQRALLWIFQHSTKNIPDFSIPLFINILQSETKYLLIDSEYLDDFLEKKEYQDITSNINLIGESVLGEKEATKRVEEYIQALGNPYIKYISIKISTIDSLINPLDFENCVERLVRKVVLIFRQAKKNSFLNNHNQKEMKFVNFDMEEYKDLHLTIEVLKRVLDKEEFKDFKAGVVLQAYLPDSYEVLKELILWAKNRQQRGGAAIKVRLVKGANLEMELTASDLRGWETPTFKTKHETDTHYKKMLLYSLKKENMEAVNIAIGSHNIFELAFAYEVAKSNGVLDYLTFEMLEGMAESTRVAIKTLTKDITLYTPVVSTKNFTSAIAYLVRRLDENSSADNFIKYSFGLQVGSCEWSRQETFFLESLDNIESLSSVPKRIQNRLSHGFDQFTLSSYEMQQFKNEPDTDFILPNNQLWAQYIVEKYKKNQNSEIVTIGVVLGSQEFIDERDIVTVYDKSQLPKDIVVGQFAKANKTDVQIALACASNDLDGFSQLSFDEIHKIFKDVATHFRQRRGDLIGIAAAEVGKTFAQTDVEVSEAIDFIEFYPLAVKKFESLNNIKFEEKGLGVVIAPWNFPIAILAGSIASALACKNRVIVKPSTVSTLCAYAVCQCFWDAGISQSALQFLPCSGEFAQEHLISDKVIDFVILTGSEQTSYAILEKSPNLFLSAETGGKNATIVTALSDSDQAIKNVCESAFLNSGQKCSATSLLVLEEELFWDEEFKNKLIDCASSYSAGSVWDFKNQMGPLCNKIAGNLKQALIVLEKDEQWALKPQRDDSNEYILKPTIKWNVQKDSFTFTHELFGPLLSVVCAKNLAHAVELVNSTGYGLTCGLESLDDREIEYFKKHINVGNLYINRGTTGAIVLRQPFGGFGKSAVGANRKVGTFNYVTQFLSMKEVSMPLVPKEFTHPLLEFVNVLKKEDYVFEECEKLEIAIKSYLFNYQEEFSQVVDHFKLRGEENIFRYIPLRKVLIRISEGDTLFEILSRVFACKIAQVPFTLSSLNYPLLYELMKKHQNELMGKNDEFIIQSDEEMGKILKDFDRIIYSNINKVPQVIFKLAVENRIFIVRNSPLMEGRIELLNYFKEQSISHSYHRYGNISAWSLEHHVG